MTGPRYTAALSSRNAHRAAALLLPILLFMSMLHYEMAAKIPHHAVLFGGFSIEYTWCKAHPLHHTPWYLSTRA